jgi:hypothetical protein
MAPRPTTQPADAASDNATPTPIKATPRSSREPKRSGDPGNRSPSRPDRGEAIGDSSVGVVAQMAKGAATRRTVRSLSD